MQLASCVACCALLLVLSLQLVLTTSVEDYSEVTELPPPPQIEEHTEQEDEILPEVVVHLAPEEQQSTTSTTEGQPQLQGHRQKKSPYCVQVHGGAPHEGPYDVCDQKLAGVPYNGGRPDYDPLHNLAQAAIASAAYGASHYVTHPEAPPLTPHVMQPAVYAYPSPEPVMYEANYQALPATYAALTAPAHYGGSSGAYGERISLMPAYTSSSSSKMRADSEQRPKKPEGVVKNDTNSATTPPSTGRASDYNPPSMYHHAQPAQYQTPYQLPMKVVGYVSASPVGFSPTPYRGSPVQSYSAPQGGYGGKVGGHSSSYSSAGTAYGREYSPPSPTYLSGGSYGSSSPSSSYSSYGGHGGSYSAPSSASHTYVKPGSGTNYSSGHHSGGYSSYSGSKGTEGSHGSYNTPKPSPSYSANQYGNNHPSGANYASLPVSLQYTGNSYAGNSYGSAHQYSASPAYNYAPTQSYSSVPYAAAPSYAPAYGGSTGYSAGPTYAPASPYTPQQYGPHVAPQSAAYGSSYRESGPDYYSPIPSYSPATSYTPSAPYGANYGSASYGGPYGGSYSTAHGSGGYGRPVEAQTYGSYGSGGGYTSGPAYTGGGGYGGASYGPYQGPSIPLSISCQVQPANMHPAIGAGYETYRESNEPANHMVPSSRKPQSPHSQQQQGASPKPQGTTHKSSSEESDEKQKARDDVATTPRSGAPSKPVSDDPQKTATGGPRPPSKTPTSVTLPSASARSSSGDTRFPPPPFPNYGPEYY